jgi:PAS domain S-box-containing protein/putative nucleotidyltransferase with HDIG domain
VALEFALTVFAAIIVTIVVIHYGLIDALALRFGRPEGDLADYGPGLLVLASGLGIMAFRRWRESQRERLLHDAETTRYQALAGNTRDILYFADPEGRIVDCNEAALLRYGYTKEEFASKTIFDLRAPGTAMPTGVDLTEKPGDTAQYDQMHALKDGTVIELSISAQRVLIGSQELIVCVGRDVTEKRRAVRELRQSEARYRGLIEMSPTPMLVYTSDRTIVFANQATLDMLRAREPSQIVGHIAGEFIHPDSQAVATAGRAQLERDGKTPFSDIRLVRLDGSPVAVQMASSRTTFDGLEAYQIVMQDVSALKNEAENLKRTTENTISAMARLAETRDPYTSGHQERVAAMAFRIGQRMGLSEATCETIRVAGIVHDIGKMSVPAEILSKPGRLTEAEFSLIMEHAENGYELLLPIEFPWPIAEIVREHHERLNGSGYPRGLEDGAICIEARVIAVADTVEAMSAHRPYRPALGIAAALQVIREGRGRLFDPAAVDAALELADEGTLLEVRAGTDDEVWSAA